MKEMLAGMALIGAMVGCWGGSILHLKSGDVGTAALGMVLDGLPAPGRRLVEGRSRVIVQYDYPPSASDITALEGMGGEVSGPVPEDALMVMLPDGASLAGLAGVKFVGRLMPVDKVSALIRGPVLGWMVVEFFPDVTPEQAETILQRSFVVEGSGAGLLPFQKLVWGGQEEASRLAEWNETAYVFPGGVQDPAARPCSFGGIGGASRIGRMGQYVANSASSWALGGPTTVGYFLEPIPDGVSEGDVRDAVQAVLAEWSRYTLLQFQPASGGRDARTLSLKFALGEHGDGFPFDGPGGVMAHAFYPAPFNGEPLAGDLHLDLAEGWTPDMLYAVILHEAGHALGLVHVDDAGAVMYPMYRRFSGLGAADIGGIRASYGAQVVDDEAQGDLGLEITGVVHNVGDFAPGELAAVAGKAWGGTALNIRWRYAGGKDWTSAPGSYKWLAPMVPVFGQSADIVIEVSDSLGRVTSQTVHIDRLPE